MVDSINLTWKIAMRLHSSTLLRTFAAFTWILLVSACSSVPQVGSPDNELVRNTSKPDQINWPARYRLEDATFKVQNAIDINASANVVWDLLIDAERWPDWYVGASKVRISSPSPPSTANPQGKLSAGAGFTWDTMGLNFASTITEFEPPYRLSW